MLLQGDSINLALELAQKDKKREKEKCEMWNSYLLE